MKRWIIVSMVVLVVSILPLMAQGDDVTSTPAPSKTPTVAATETSNDAPTEVENNDSAISDWQLERAYTLQDMNILQGNVQRPNGIVWLNDTLYTACNGDWTLYEIDSRTGYTETFVSGVRNSFSLYGENTDAGFNLWIPDFDPNTESPEDRLVRLDHTKTYPEVIASEGLNGPWGIDSLDDDHFLVSNIRSNDLVSVSRDGEVSQLVTGFRSPTGIVVTDDDHVYVANNGSARRAIEWFTLDDLDDEESVEGITESLVSGLQNVTNIVIAPDGYLYFAYARGTSGTIGRVNPQECREKGGCTNEDVEDVVYDAELRAPLTGLSVSDDLRLFVHTIYSPEIYWVELYPETVD